ncbi:MAG: hypothetical protein R3E98_15500 [Gemmatimonadota bacterium]
MVHVPTFGPFRVRRQPVWGPLLPFLALVALGIGACASDTGTQPGQFRFGQLGEIRVTVVSPLIVVQNGTASTQGELQQVFSWNSNGAWQILESVSYQGRVGDQDLMRAPGNPAFYQGGYATLITHLNDTPALQLLGIEDLDPDLSPDCFGDGRDSRSKVIVQISDSISGGRIRWTRCAEGTLGDLTPEGAGPGESASRVVQAAVLARDFALGERWQSRYVGTLPFGTLDKGEGSLATSLTQPRVFRLGPNAPSSSTNAPAEFATFWRQHKGQDQAPPNVDWQRQMVVVAAIGPVPEAGDSIEVRRIVEEGLGTTLVEFYERQPGDFCSPASRTQIPYHIVVAPRVTNLVRFADPRVERVPCV